MGARTGSGLRQVVAPDDADVGRDSGSVVPIRGAPTWARQATDSRLRVQTGGQRGAGPDQLRSWPASFDWSTINQHGLSNVGRPASMVRSSYVSAFDHLFCPIRGRISFAIVRLTGTTKGAQKWIKIVPMWRWTSRLMH